MLGDNVVLGAGAYVARDCRLENVVVLPNTFISQGFVAGRARLVKVAARRHADSNVFVFRGQGFGVLRREAPSGVGVEGLMIEGNAMMLNAGTNSKRSPM